MRRLAVISLAFSALAVPAAALAATATAGDGTLVVKNGTAPDSGPDKVPVVRLKITGSVIGQLTGQGRIIIDAGADLTPTVEVTGAAGPSSVPQSDTAKLWVGDANGFKFRAVDGTFTVVVYGTHVSLVAVGTGTVTLAGTPGSATDGRYSLNGDDFKPLLGTPTARLSIGSDG